MVEIVKRFHQETVLIPDLDDGVSYTSFFNELQNGWFKLSLAKQKETNLTKAVKKVVDIIKTIEICVETRYHKEKGRMEERNLIRLKGGRKIRHGINTLM